MLQDFYNSHAKEFSQTRNKVWTEMNFIREQLLAYQNKNPSTLSIVDIGCGDGRLYEYLSHNISPFSYTGIDFSEGLLSIAREKYPHVPFLFQDMSELTLPPQSVDVALFFASFHHLRSVPQRIKCLRLLYQSLTYGGIVIFVNRNLWQPNYYKLVIQSSLTSMIGKNAWNDCFVPWQGKEGNVYYRYYHMFTRKEISSLLTGCGFIVTDNFFIDKTGNKNKRWESRNLITIAKKSILH